MKRIILGLLIIGLTARSYAQIIELEEIVVKPINFRYLDKVGFDNTDDNVKMLQDQVATFDVTETEYYSEEYDNYYVSFRIPEGKIAATYDENGDIIKTIERFKNVKLPEAISKSIVKNMVGWKMVGDVYLVSYNKKSDDAKKFYKIKLERGSKRQTVKMDELGNFL